MGVRRLAVVNGPNIFQMLLVFQFVVFQTPFFATLSFSVRAFSVRGSASRGPAATADLLAYLLAVS